MDFLMGVVSIVKDMGTVDKEYKNLNLQLKYTLDKSKRLLKKIGQSQNNLGLAVLKARIEEGESFIKKLDQLLNTESIAMKDKIRLSLPFTKTKSEIIDVIESLERLVNDLKEQSVEETANQDRVQTKTNGIKRMISCPNVASEDPQINITKSIRIEPTVQQIDDRIQEVYEMGPTIKEDEYLYSQTRNKSRQVEFIVKIHGPQEVVKILQAQNLLTIKSLIKEDSIPEEQILYNVARMNFQKCYAKIKAITKDIDRISTKGHFQFIFRKGINSNINHGETLKVHSNHKNSGSRHRSSGSQKQDEEVFFSFPVDENHSLEFKLVAKKEDEAKTMYRQCGEQWIKVDKPEIEVLNGDKLAAFINPQTKLPTIYFQICYQQAHS